MYHMVEQDIVELPFVELKSFRRTTQYSTACQVGTGKPVQYSPLRSHLPSIYSYSKFQELAIAFS